MRTKFELLEIPPKMCRKMFILWGLTDWFAPEHSKKIQITENKNVHTVILARGGAKFGTPGAKYGTPLENLLGTRGSGLAWIGNIIIHCIWSYSGVHDHWGGPGRLSNVLITDYICFTKRIQLALEYGFGLFGNDDFLNCYCFVSILNPSKLFDIILKWEKWIELDVYVPKMTKLVL